MNRGIDRLTMFDVRETGIPGCLLIRPPKFKDRRGFFTKILHRDAFAERGLETQFTEEYYTFSNSGVLRGLHFQVPPEDHTKIVYCAHGQAMDAVVDLRVGSPSFGKFELFRLDPESGDIVYIPPGLAHGFYVTGEDALMVYKVTSVHSPEHDRGILWDSAGIPWPDTSPVISERDAGFPPFADFHSPFLYKLNSG